MNTNFATIIPYSQFIGNENEIIDMILSIQNNEFGLDIKLADQPDLLNIKQFYLAPEGNFWIAYVGKDIVGTVAVLPISKNEVVLRKMFVKKEYRGRDFSIAKELLEIAIAWSNEKKFQYLLLGTTDKFKAAHRFYEKHRFYQVHPSSLPATFPRMKVDTIFYQLKLSSQANQ